MLNIEESVEKIVQRHCSPVAPMQALSTLYEQQREQKLLPQLLQFLCKKKTHTHTGAEEIKLEGDDDREPKYTLPPSHLLLQPPPLLLQPKSQSHGFILTLFLSTEKTALQLEQLPSENRETGRQDMKGQKALTLRGVEGKIGGGVEREWPDLWRRLGSVCAASPSAWTPCCEWARCGSSVRFPRWCRTPEHRGGRRHPPGGVRGRKEGTSMMSARGERGEEPEWFS